MADTMPKVAKELGPLAVSRLSIPGKHAVGRVAGPALQITPTGSRSWILRVMVGGRSIRLFNVIDDFNREALGIEIDFSLPSERVIHTLRQIIGWRGRPLAIRCDNVLNASGFASRGNGRPCERISSFAK